MITIVMMSVHMENYIFNITKNSSFNTSRIVINMSFEMFHSLILFMQLLKSQLN